MPGVVFLIVVPTANFERELVYDGEQNWDNNELLTPVISQQQKLTNNIQHLISTPPSTTSTGTINGIHSQNGGNNLNINLPDNNNAILRLEVELRDKNAPKNRRGVGMGRGGRGRIGGGKNAIIGSELKSRTQNIDGQKENNINVMVPMEKVLEELLYKLEIEHVTWSIDKKGYYYHVIFPIQSGEPCETTLHCLTELGIGTKLNSSVSVLPCSVSYDAISDTINTDEFSDEKNEQLSKWNNFVESIKSKLTVKQVVDGVRAGGSLSFDYLLLIVTADSLAALGLVENNAPNIVAAMLVSPLMGPVMSITFGAIISDRELMKVGFISLALGMFISMLFGFIFGLILGTTEMPWGFGDWPTEEMKGRGNARSLWMGVLWALTSGTGVAVALLQGSAGPLIGVAISASLLPPVVNCGLFWALACIWLIYPDIKLPHLKGELYTGNTTYQFIYTNYLPTEFLINGIVSGLLTVVNVICIFITAIIVLKIKEVSAPYTASPDLKRFWETDLRTARATNRSTIRQRKTTFKGKHLPYEGLQEPRNHELETVLEQAIQEASDDVTLKKVKRMSYSSNAAGELTGHLPYNNNNNNNHHHHHHHHQQQQQQNLTKGSLLQGIDIVNGNMNGNSGLNTLRNSKLNVDLKVLDKLLSAMLEENKNIDNIKRKGGNGNNDDNHKSSMKLNRLKPLSRSITSISGIRRNGSKRKSIKGDAILDGIMTSSFNNGRNSLSSNLNNNNGNNNSGGMPTIMEQNQSISSNDNKQNSINSWTEKRTNGRNSSNINVRNVLNSIVNAPQRFSYNAGQQNEENMNLAENIG